MGPRLGSLLFFSALAVVHTWPLATAPGTLSRNDTSDTILHEWIMAWVVHQIATDPLHLFDANIFYPERYTLAYSDHLFVQALMAAPLIWAGASPVLAHNLVLIAGFALTGWTTSLLVQRWTSSWMAGYLSGSLVAFNAFTLTRLAQIQDLHLEFLPLALLALDRLLTAPGARHAAQLAGWYVLQALTGTYLMTFTAIALVAGVAARPGDWIGARFRRFAPWALAAALLSVVGLLPFLLPYLYVTRAVGLGRSLETMRELSAEWTDYLATGGRVHFESWSRPYFAGDALFPGVTALVLASVAVLALAATDSRARMVTAFGLAAFALSFGPAFPPYEWLLGVFPPLNGIRGPVRFGQLALAAVGILAGFGLMVVQARLRRPLALALGLVALATANAEALRAPLFYSTYRGIPPVYDALEKMGDRAVLAWLPMPAPGQFFQNAPFMLVSSRSWNKMLNGYSGFMPPSYRRHAERLASFPDEGSIDYLQEQRVTHVLVDGRNMRPERLAALEQVQALSLWETDGNLRIYRLEH